jgi:hypothetical protein
MNSEARLRLLDDHLSAIAVENQAGWIESNGGGNDDGLPSRCSQRNADEPGAFGSS